MTDEFENDEEQAPQHWLPQAIENCGCAIALLLVVLLLFSAEVVHIIEAIRGKP